MSTILQERTGTPTEVVAPELRLSLSHRLFTAVAVFAMVVGAVSVLGGLGGAIYTYQQAAAQDVTTPDDARFPEVPVRGPLSMWAQSDIITHHQLDRTEGRYYAQMEREVPMVDDAGEPVLDEAGEPVMGPNEARASWLDATTLTTSLGLGMLAYGLSAFAVAAGLVMLALGFVVRKLRSVPVAVH
ncbi:MAG: hypothetical protein KY461_14070 [Actinobacteria bacterium]|nr:hypothetical protein [Actinomycetota bacterium]